jgi:DNA-directed RNA polymerase subunit RPC12/RpoP
MVREVTREDDTIYRCEECGQTFDDEEAAQEHEDDCFVPPSM